MKIKFLLAIVLLAVISCNNPDTTENTTPKQENNKIKVAVFKGNGAGAVSVIETIEALRIDSGIQAEAISATEIQAGKLSEYDALVFPGGSGSKELNNLGKTGKTIVSDFIKNQGKGIVGICAGGYLLSSTSGYPNLQLCSAVHLDRAHYNRGRGLMEFALTKSGKAIFPELGDQRLFLQYYDGPVLAHSDSTTGDYEDMARFVSDIHPDNFAPEGITPGQTFWLTEKVGKGKLFITAGHPESTPGMRWVVARMVRLVCDKELISYNAQWIRPEINDTSIFFTREMRKFEKETFWKLFSDDAEVQIQAMDTLYALRSRPAVRWYMGLLRDENAETRKHAAYLLRLTEYSYAIPDLKEAISIEKNTGVKQEMQKSLDFLISR